MFLNGGNSRLECRKFIRAMQSPQGCIINLRPYSNISQVFMYFTMKYEPQVWKRKHFRVRKKLQIFFKSSNRIGSFGFGFDFSAITETEWKKMPVL